MKHTVIFLFFQAKEPGAEGECGAGAGDHGAGVWQGPHPHLPGIETSWLVGPLDGWWLMVLVLLHISHQTETIGIHNRNTFTDLKWSRAL